MSAEAGPETACGICDHDPACGFAMVSRPDGDDVRLCHTSLHSCYKLWTLGRVRRAPDGTLYVQEDPAPPIALTTDFVG